MSTPTETLARAFAHYLHTNDYDWLVCVALAAERAALPPTGWDDVELEVARMFLAGDREAVPLHEPRGHVRIINGRKVTRGRAVRRGRERRTV